MRKILVTGGMGFIGSNYIRYMLENNPEEKIVNYDLLTYAGNPQNLKGIDKKYTARYTFVKGDLCDGKTVEKLFLEHEPSAIINFAAESHVDRSIEDPNVFIRTNVLGTATLLNAARNYWKSDLNNKRFLQVSTDEVYGSLPEDDLEVKFTEETPLNPHSPYSASKTSADLIVKSYYDTFGFPVLTTRCSNNYGPFQFPEKLIPVIISKAMKNENLPVYGDGKNIRDWLFVEDHCSAITVVLEKGKPGEVYNIGGNNEIQNIEIVKMILDHLNKPHSLITYVKDRLGHDRRYAIDASKIKNELGWEPEFRFEDKIGFTIDWYIKNEKWISDILTGKYQAEG